MNFPSASPNENMNIDNSINPIPARRAERSSAALEILASRLIWDSLKGELRLSGCWNCLQRHSGMRPLAQARNPYSRSWLRIPGSLVSLTPRYDEYFLLVAPAVVTRSFA